MVLNDLHGALAEEAAEAIQKAGGRCLAVAGDASDEDVIANMVQQAVTHFGKLTIAVANAGITLFGDFFEYPAADLRRVLETNLMGSFLLTQAAARQMRHQELGQRTGAFC